MLLPSEFSVGAFGSALPLSLILPRNRHEEYALIGEIEGTPTAVVLSGQFSFRFFQSRGNDHWRGLIIPNVHIEVDETSLFDPDYDGAAMGTVLRCDTRLIVRARAEQSFGQSTAVTLHGDLPSAGPLSAAFSKWQVALGEGLDRRVLWQTPDDEQ